MTVNTQYFEEEIDLRKWINVLIRRKWWILGISVLAAALSFGVASFLTKGYEATSIAAVAQVYNQLRFDPRIETVSDARLNFQSFATLALSDSIIDELYNSLDDLPHEFETPLELHDALETSVVTDLIQLTVKTPDPELSVQIANRWVNIFVVSANRIYGATDGDQLPFFEAQFVDAKNNLDSAHNALIEFQSRNLERILVSRQQSLEVSLSNLYTRQQEIGMLQRDIQTLIDQLGQQPATQTASQSVELSVLLLQTRAFSVRQTTYSLQFQISGASETTSTLGDLIRQLNGLLEAMQGQLADLELEINQLEPLITETQRQLEEATSEKDSLNSQLRLAQETYQVVGRKVDETRISSQDTSGQVKVASYAHPKDEPAGPGRVLIVAVAGVAAFVLTTVVVLVLEWWKSSEDAAAPSGA